MLQRVAVTPQYPLIIDFADGTSKRCLICIESLILMIQEFGEIQDVLKEYETKPYDLTAIILYSGMKLLHPETTLEECQAILMGGGVPLMNKVLEVFNENIGSMDSEQLKKSVQERVDVMLKQQKQQ